MLRLTSAIVTLIALGAAGCDCGSKKGPTLGPCENADGTSMCAEAMPPATAGSRCCEPMNMCVLYDLDALCMPGYTCAGPSNVIMDEMSCALTCDMCMVKPALPPGQLATYLDAVVQSDGTTLISGYSPGDPPGRRYGDLVFGAYDPATMSVDWEIVDGAPSSPITNDPMGWRGGVSAAGDDVGRWTSMVEHMGGEISIAHYDATNGALRMARRPAGGSDWETFEVDGQGDAGRYASMVLDAAGRPVIAYLRIEPSVMTPGRLTASVMVAQAAMPLPSGPPDFTVTAVTSVEMMCRPQFCAMGEVCLESGACVSPSGACTPECMSDQACVAGTCETILADPYVEDYPPATGLYNSIARTPTGLGLVFYDRSTGNLYGAANDGAWSAPFLIDGYGRMESTTGDSGIGASLFVDGAGAWHVTYVDGAEETLRYARVEAGVVSVREVVDDGATDGTMPNPDGRHFVGDDSSVVVTEAGEIRVVYQDATAHRTMMARRPVAGGTWAISVVDAMDHTGFWTEQILVGTTSYVAEWWRNDPMDNANGIRVLMIE